MSEKSFLDSLIGAWKTNLEAPDDEYDEEMSDNLLATIRETSPEAYENIKEEFGYNDIVG